MTVERLCKDFRAVDEIVVCSGEAARNCEESNLLWKCVYGLSVAVWDLLNYILKKEAKRDNN